MTKQYKHIENTRFENWWNAKNILFGIRTENTNNVLISDMGGGNQYTKQEAIELFEEFIDVIKNNGD